MQSNIYGRNVLLAKHGGTRATGGAMSDRDRKCGGYYQGIIDISALRAYQNIVYLFGSILR